jgi:disulfide bond formation protein DsbB
VFLGTAAALAEALFMQHGQGLQPCTLCIIQRYAYTWVGLWALVALCLPLRSISQIAATAGILGAIGGIIAAGRNLWVLAHPDILCGRDPVEIFLNSLPTAQWLPKVFVASGLCTSPIPPLFGLAFPVWSLLGLLIFAVLLGLTLRQR